MKYLLPVFFLLLNAFAFAGEQVVVYTALDRQFSEPILKDFESRTGIEVRPVYDAEAVKTVGLVNRLMAERGRPVCDVFWNNEIVRSIQMKREGLTQPYNSPSAADIPMELKDPEFHWTGFAARVRVLAINTKLVPNPAEWPRRFADLCDPKWRGRAGFARPLFGTTSTHAAVLYQELGAQRSAEFWRSAKANAVTESSNGQVCDSVANGELAWGLTDTDDAHGAIEDGKPIAIVYADADTTSSGIIVIPNTVVLIQDAPHAANGRKLIDYLLSREVEATLATSRSAQIPVRAGIEPPAGIPPIVGVKIRPVDWNAAAGGLVPCQKGLNEVFAQ